MSVPIGCMKFLFVNLYLPMVFGHHFWLELIFPPSDWDTPSAHPRPLSPPIRRAWAYYLVPIIRVPRFKIFRTNSLAPNPICWVPPPPGICSHTKGMSAGDLRACSLVLSLSPPLDHMLGMHLSLFSGKVMDGAPDGTGTNINTPFLLSLHMVHSVCVCVGECNDIG